jgi:hypothetical protein
MENTTPKLQAFFKAIWPTVYRITNGGLYFVLNLLKTIVKMSIQQVTKW